MIDFDVNDIDFIDISFARYHDFDFISLKHSRSLTIVDDRNSTFDDVIHIMKVSFMICNHFEIIEFFVTKLNHYSIILELSWLKLHDLISKWSNNFLTFFSLYCYTHCLRFFRLMIVIDVNNQFDVLFQFLKILNILKENLKFNQISRTNINVVKFTKIKNNKKIIISTIETKIFEKNLKTNVQVFKNTFVKITISKKFYVLIVFKFITKEIVKVENLKKISKKFSLFENYKISIVENKQNKETHKIARIQLIRDMKSLNMNFIESISFNTWMNRSKKNINIEIYSIFIRDIE